MMRAAREGIIGVPIGTRDPKHPECGYPSKYNDVQERVGTSRLAPSTGTHAASPIAVRPVTTASDRRSA